MKPIVTVEGKPVRYYTLDRWLQEVQDGYIGQAKKYSILPNSLRAEMYTRDGRVMLFDHAPERTVRPSGRPLYAFGKPLAVAQMSWGRGK